MQSRKIMIPVIAIVAAFGGYVAGYATKSTPQQVLSGHFEDFSMIPSAAAQENKQENKAEPMPFGYNSPRQPALAPDAPPITYWNIDDIKKAHAEMEEKAAKMVAQAGSGSSQSIGGGPVHIQTRNFSMFMLYRMHREQPVLSLTKVNSVWDDAEMHAGAYDFYVITGGTGEMIVGGSESGRLAAHPSRHAASAKARCWRLQLLHHENQCRDLSLEFGSIDKILHVIG